MSQKRKADDSSLVEKDTKQNKPDWEQLMAPSKVGEFDLPHSQSCTNVGDVIPIQRLFLAGLGSSGADTVQYYVRLDAVTNWNILQNHDWGNGLIFQGLPGVGKSLLAWAWCCNTAQTKKVLWLHVNKSGFIKIVALASNKCYAYGETTQKGCDLIRMYDGDVVVIDGMREGKDDDLGREADRWFFLKPSRRILFITSHVVNRQSEEEYVEVEMVSWTLEEMLAACDNVNFFKEVSENIGTIPYETIKNVYDEVATTESPDKIEVAVHLRLKEIRDDLVKDKYSITGGSARWMFKCTTNTAVSNIKKCLATCSDFKMLLAGLKGAKATESVRHLLGSIRMHQSVSHYLGSRFIAVELARVCESSFVREATRHSQQFNNSAFDGWIFQMDFFMQLNASINKKHPLELLSKQGQIYWEAQRQIDFIDPTDLQGAKIVGSANFENVQDVQDNCWLILKRWNQACYDAAQVLEYGLRVVQVTRGKTHSLKLDFIPPLIMALINIGRKVEHIEIVVVVPEAEIGAFTISSSSVRGENLLSTYKWKLSDLIVCGMRRTE
eukprot:Phypoly_transcript_04662.p1 GENE.Phypoly_transcript_04662~~Phypoly_transcript_04662.p1  ORF type:complete len:553 (+),score=43.34 Phypoly_transcript_04662:310-1968(+)